MKAESEASSGRRELLKSAGRMTLAAAVGAVATPLVYAKDYHSRREALDELDSLSAVCRMRLSAVRRSRSGADVLASRFQGALERHRAVRESVRRQFSLPGRAESASAAEPVDGDLGGLRQSLDDLMVAYAESLPIFGDSRVVSRLARDMVEVSTLRTVIDLWIGDEQA